MTHFLKNTPAMNGAKVLPMFLVEIIDIEYKTKHMITVHAKNQKDALANMPKFIGRPTGLIFPIADIA